MEENNNTTRLGFLDVAKGIGIVAVVIGHSIRPEVLPSRFISMWHLPLFFFVSGLCFNANKYCSRFSMNFLAREVEFVAHQKGKHLYHTLHFLGCNSLAILIFHMWWMRLLKDFLRPIIGIGIEPILVWPLLLVTIYVINRYVPWVVGKK